MFSRRAQHTVFTAATLAVLLSISLPTSTASACPNCKASLPSGAQVEGAPAEPKTAQGYAWSIYLFLAVPLVMVTTMGATAFVLMRKASARQRMLAARHLN